MDNYLSLLGVRGIIKILSEWIKVQWCEEGMDETVPEGGEVHRKSYNGSTTQRVN